jgi:hypothetical protein
MQPKLLTRDEFRDAVFGRDRHVCVFCSKPAVDAHHILERRLWPDGGYYLENGAAVCAEHHLACERTEISVAEVRRACGLVTAWLPPHLETSQAYDKWGNPELPNGQRLKGELFFDDNVRKTLAAAGKLPLFAPWVKYPRTYHLPWSPGRGADDRVLTSLANLAEGEVVATEKMDGENTTLYADHTHARSLDSRSHPARDWLKQYWSGFARDIPPGWRICGENLYARHSLAYTALPSYFLGFSIWNERNVALSWDETLEWFSLLRIEPVPLLYRGAFDESRLRALSWPAPSLAREGYVVRVAGEIPYGAFRRSVAKFVRAGHVQTSEHWMHREIERNTLAKT